MHASQQGCIGTETEGQKRTLSASAVTREKRWDGQTDGQTDGGRTPDRRFTAPAEDARGQLNNLVNSTMSSPRSQLLREKESRLSSAEFEH